MKAHAFGCCLLVACAVIDPRRIGGEQQVQISGLRGVWRQLCQVQQVLLPDPCLQRIGVLDQNRASMGSSGKARRAVGCGDAVKIIGLPADMPLHRVIVAPVFWHAAGGEGFGKRLRERCFSCAFRPHQHHALLIVALYGRRDHRPVSVGV